MARVDFSTDRVDLFAREHFGSFSDDNIRKLIRYNFDYFVGNPIIWLREGADLNTVEPPPQVGRLLLLDDESFMVFNDFEYFLI